MRCLLWARIIFAPACSIAPKVCFSSFADGGGRHVQALRYLLRIYEQQRDWEQAIVAHRKLVAVASPEHPTAIAHYHCELAEQMRAKGDFTGAREQLHLARDAQRNFPRGALIRADIALDMNQPELAALLCQRAVELHPKLLTLALPRVMRAMRGTDAGEIERRFRAWMRPDPVARAELAYAAIVAGLEQEPFVRECLPDLLREDPTLGEIVSATSGDPSHLTAEQCTALATAFGRILRRTQRYRCVDCGFASAAHFWQCPGCRSWDAFAPVASAGPDARHASPLSTSAGLRDRHDCVGFCPDIGRSRDGPARVDNLRRRMPSHPSRYGKLNTFKERIMSMTHRSVSNRALPLRRAVQVLICSLLPRSGLGRPGGHQHRRRRHHRQGAARHRAQQGAGHRRVP